MSTSSRDGSTSVKWRKSDSSALGRRQLLALLMASVVAPMAMPAWLNLQPGRPRIVIVNGWILLEDDVREVAGNAA